MDEANPRVMNEDHQTPTLSSITSQSTASRGGRICCVPDCNNNSRHRADLSYHKLPKEPKLRKKVDQVIKNKRLL